MATLVGALVAAVPAPAGATAASPTAVAPVDATAEAGFVTELNQLRATKHLPALSVDPRLTALARTWATKMAAKGDIFHNMQLPEQAPPEWIRLGENVGVDDDVADAVAALHAAFVRSPTHYRNLVGRYTAVGIGVVHAGGRIYVAEEFMASAPAPPPSRPAPRHRRSHGWSSPHRR